ncbi:hypothetical protein FA95DRAFT_1456545, partial [Auriscalpium vulgare]
MTDNTKATIAAAPFDDPRADLVLESSDGTLFHVHAIVLSLASPIFADMFNLPQPAAGQPTTHAGVPTVCVAESAHTLGLLLRWCYPIAAPPFAALDDIRLLLETARKYGIDLPAGAIAYALQGMLNRDPLGVFCVAVGHGLAETARVAARATLQHPFVRLDSPQLQYIPVKPYQQLMGYHAAC